MKAAPITAKRPGRADRAAIVDEYGELRRKLALAKPDADRARELGEEIASWFDGKPGDQEFEVEGRRYIGQVSARQLGPADAPDAVQETWLRLAQSS